MDLEVEREVGQQGCINIWGLHFDDVSLEWGGRLWLGWDVGIEWGGDYGKEWDVEKDNGWFFDHRLIIMIVWYW